MAWFQEMDALMGKSVAVWLLACLLCVAPLAIAQEPLAPVEARVPFAPTAFGGSDGLTHLAYELHVTSIYGDTGPPGQSTARLAISATNTSESVVAVLPRMMIVMSWSSTLNNWVWAPMIEPGLFTTGCFAPFKVVSYDHSP